MARNRRIDATLDLTPEDVYELEAGHRFFRRDGAPPDLAAAWQAVGQPLTAAHVATFPKSRPHGWWVYAVTERRLQTDDGPTHTMLRLGSRVTPQYFYGAPGTHAAADQHSLFECQHEFLARHRLYLPQEATRPCAACVYTGGFGQPHLTFQQVRAWYEALTA
jgi:hypothetical protein